MRSARQKNNWMREKKKQSNARRNWHPHALKGVKPAKSAKMKETIL
jgi:hypothetical protein